MGKRRDITAWCPINKTHAIIKKGMQKGMRNSIIILVVLLCSLFSILSIFILSFQDSENLTSECLGNNFSIAQSDNIDNHKKSGEESRQDDPWPGTGNWQISNGANIIVNNRNIRMNGSIIIDGSSSLSLYNSTLTFECTQTNQYRFEVQANGRLFINNSQIRAASSRYPFQFVVRTNARFVLERSMVSYCGTNSTTDKSMQGLYIESNFAEISNCVIQNCYIGIIVMKCSPTISENTIRDCKTAGIRFRSSSGILDGNRILNSSTGIIADQGTGTIRNNYLHGNYGAGITILPGSNMTILNNIINGTDYYTRKKTGINTIGIDVHGTEGVYTSPLISGGSVEECFIGISANTTSTPSFVNVSIVNSTLLDVRTDGKSNVSMLNCMFVERKVYVGTDCILKVDGYLTIVIERMDGSRVSGANVVMHSKDNKILCNTTTDISGLVADVVVPIFLQKSSIKEEKTPYLIHVEKDEAMIDSRIFSTSGIVTIILDAKVDIEIEPLNISWSPERPAENQAVEINVTINNLGYDIAHGILVVLYIDEERIDECSIESIHGSKVSRVTFSWIARPGIHTISVNASCSEKEINNGNNKGTRTISVKQNLRADLTINSFSQIYSIYYAYNSNSYTTTKPGDLVGFVGEIWCRVGYNEDEILEVEDVEIAFFVDNAKVPEKVILIERLPTSSSNPFYWGSSYDYENYYHNDAALRVYFIWEAKVGTHYITLKVDPNNNISEIYSAGSEENNNRECAITVNAPSIIEGPTNFALVGVCCLFPVILTGISGIIFLYLLRKPVTQPATQRPYYYQGQYLQNIVPSPPQYYYSTYRNQYGTIPQTAQQYYYNPVTRSWAPSQNPQYYQSYPRQYPSAQPTPQPTPKYYYNPYTRSWVPYPQPTPQTQTHLDTLHESIKKQLDKKLNLKTISKASISGRKSVRIGEDAIKELEPSKAEKLETPSDKVVIAQVVDAKVTETKIVDAKVVDSKIESKVKEETALQSKSREGILESADLESEQRPHKKVFIVRNCPKCGSENIEIIEDSKVKCNSCGRLFRMKSKS